MGPTDPGMALVWSKSRKAHPMKSIRPSTHYSSLALLMLAFSIYGCAAVSPSPDTHASVPDVVINGHSAHLLLDTGAEGTVIFNADKLGLKAAANTPAARGSANEPAVSEPVTIQLGPDEFKAQLMYRPFPWYLRAYLALSSDDMDGVLGWPELKSNILVLDPRNLSIKGVNELPANAVSWLKFHTVPRMNLWLEIPLADGKSGLLQVDTGNPYGVALSPSLWQSWLKSHPQATLVQRNQWGPDGSVASFAEAWADAIQIGPLTLTDVPIHAATKIELVGTPENYLGLLGLYALSRMDTVLDGKGGLAYFHPLDPPGPPYPGFPRPGDHTESAPSAYPSRAWTTTDLHIDGRMLQANTLHYLGSKKLLEHDYAAVIADYTEVLRLVPQQIAANLFRGVAKLNLADYPGALADLQRFDNESKRPDPLLKSGFTKLKAGDYEGAKADYKRALGL
ncbi:MAG TPA: hypothetical protein VHC95_03220 [Opitutales bacterium]|nr:hypothetical protein [Opitutales bacterium]